MTELVQLRDRVTRLEDRVDDVENLARGTDREVADWRTTLNNHTQTLNAIREDQIAQGKRLARLEAKVDNVEQKIGTVEQKIGTVERKVGTVEQKVGTIETEMRGGFAMLAQGQEWLTELITQHIEECDKG